MEAQGVVALVVGPAVGVVVGNGRRIVVEEDLRGALGRCLWCARFHISLRSDSLGWR